MALNKALETHNQERQGFLKPASAYTNFLTANSWENNQLPLVIAGSITQIVFSIKKYIFEQLLKFLSRLPTIFVRPAKFCRFRCRTREIISAKAAT